MGVLALTDVSASLIADWIDEQRRLFYADRVDSAVTRGEEVRRAANDWLQQAEPAEFSAVLAQSQALQARAPLWLVRCMRRQDRLDKGIEYAYEGLAAAQAARDARLECQLRSQYVHMLATLGQNETALDQGYVALGQATQNQDALAQAAALLALGHVHWAMQQWEDGREAYRQSLSWAQACNDKELCGLASNGIAAMEDHFAVEARAAGRLEEAQALARHAGELVLDFAQFSREIGDVYNTWSAEHNYACCLYAMGENVAAVKMLEQQLAALADESGFRRHVVLVQLGDIELSEGQPGRALLRLKEALQIAERLQMPMFAVNACRLLVDASEKLGDLAAALAYHRRYHEFCVRLTSNQAQAHAHAKAVIHQTEKARAVAEAQRQRADQLASTNTTLSMQAESLTRASMEDALTGVANRRRFDQAMQHELAVRHATHRYSLALLDIDHFKRINDHCSHLIGDEVLRRLGAILAKNCRREDLAARSGGEEFALILNGVDHEAARQACERMRVAIETEDWHEVHPDLAVTVSIGVAHNGEADIKGGPTALVMLADNRLYAAKQAGRNRVNDSGHSAAATDVATRKSA